MSEIRREWESMNETAQFRMICNCIGKAAARLHVRINAADLAGECWIRVTTRIKERPEESLLLTVYREAHNTVQAEYRHNRKFTEADNFPVEAAGGAQVLDLVADGFGSVEALAILRADFGKFFDGLDEKNREIVTRRITDGEAQEKIATRLDISYPAVWKRLRRMRSQVAEFTY